MRGPRAPGRAPARRGEKALAHARELRAAITGVLVDAAGQRVRAEDLAAIDRVVSQAAGHTHLVPRDGGFTWEIDAKALRSLEGPLWPVARSAADLLTGGELSTVRECALETCAWLFVDRSKNQKRRWCDMKVCGNRSKVRRHYARTRGGA
jgi:predicted RNA-binding Zn ribbon-like protein